MTSRDGFQWTEQGGLKRGVPSIGVIQPASNISTTEHVFDVVIIGAGYTGLTAARDAANAGLQVLLLEGRDRIGGRSWSSNIGGYPFEMGGTWVHWGQAHIWREISRYQMRQELEISQSHEGGLNHFSMNSGEGCRVMSHAEEDSIISSALKKFANVDGSYGKIVMPYPHDAEHNPEVLKYDNLSAADRIEQIGGQLTAEERCGLEAYLLMTSGSTIAKTSFFEFLHWWALSGYTYSGCFEYLIKYKFKHGQSSFAIRFWEEAISSGNLTYSFNAPAVTVSNLLGDSVKVTVKDGRTFRAHRMISAVPLNVLNAINFHPPLPPAKQAAASVGHTNQCVKVHAEIKNRELRTWSGVDVPTSPLVYAFGDGVTPAGNTHIVAFGADLNHLEPEQDIQATLRAMNALTTMDIERLVFHNWSRDEFAKGAWFFPPKQFITKYHHALRARQGSILFASSDWAVGWRSFIDGAIEEGTRVAYEVVQDLAKQKSMI